MNKDSDANKEPASRVPHNVSPKASNRRRTPPKPGTKPQDTDGGVFERRVARLEFAEGAFVRLRVPVSADGAEQGRDVLTDIDILSIDIDSRLRSTRASLECKSGKGQSGEPYTLVWLAGFRQLLSLDRVTLVRQTVSSRGRTLAQKLGIRVLDETALTKRESAHVWLPETFAHIDGPACLAAETRTDVQLKGLPDLPASVTKFLRGGGLLADSPALLSAVESFGLSVDKQGGIPEPAAFILSSHALIAIILAAIQDAGRLDEIPADTLRPRLVRALTTGNPDDEYLLPLLERADALVDYIQDRTHRQYVEAGAKPLRAPYPSLKKAIAQHPDYLDDYVDFVERLRTNPIVARELLQTAELVCFDAGLGDTSWRSPAFAHLMTTEHHGLLAVAVRCLKSVAGEQVAGYLEGLSTFRNTSAHGAFVDRRMASQSEPVDLQSPPVSEETSPQGHSERPEQQTLLSDEGLAQSRAHRD